MILYSNGCSYTANMILDPDQKYPYLLSKKLNWELYTAAIAGSCNRRIIRSTIRDCINLSKLDEVFALIQLTHLHRTEYAGKRTKDNQYEYSYDDRYFDYDLYEGLKPNDYKGLSNHVIEWADMGYALHDDTAEFTRICSDTLGLAAFLKIKNINYCIFTAPKIDIDCQDALYKELQQDINILDPLKFNMLDLTGQQKHPDKDGMQLIADYFYNLIN